MTTKTYPTVHRGQFINPELINSVYYWKHDMTVEGVALSEFTYNTVNPNTGKPTKGSLVVDSDSWKVLSSEIKM